MTVLPNARRLVAALAVGALTMAPVAAHAADSYVGTPVPTVGAVDSGVPGRTPAGGVLGSGGVGATPQGGGVLGSGGASGSAPGGTSGSGALPLSSGSVRAAGTGRGTTVGDQGGLPVTGSDVLQLAVLGIGAVGCGVALVRSGRRRSQAT